VSDHPPLQGSPRVLLEAYLDHLRRGVAGALDGLSDEQAGRRALPGTDLTVAGVVAHLAHMEDHWFTIRFAGGPVPEPWASAPFDEDEDWDFHAGAGFGVERARDLYLSACERSRRVAGAGDLDDVAATPSFGVGPVSLGWILVHMVQETAQHLGHLDLLRDELRRTSA
jgi:uncharacterized damage-inducible protein DinB